MGKKEDGGREKGDWADCFSSSGYSTAFYSFS